MHRRAGVRLRRLRDAAARRADEGHAGAARRHRATDERVNRKGAEGMRVGRAEKWNRRGGDKEDLGPDATPPSGRPHPPPPLLFSLLPPPAEQPETRKSLRGTPLCRLNPHLSASAVPTQNRPRSATARKRRSTGFARMRRGAHPSESVVLRLAVAEGRLASLSVEAAAPPRRPVEACTRGPRSRRRAWPLCPGARAVLFPRGHGERQGRGVHQRLLPPDAWGGAALLALRGRSQPSRTSALRRRCRGCRPRRQNGRSCPSGAWRCSARCSRSR